LALLRGEPLRERRTGEHGSRAGQHAADVTDNEQAFLDDFRLTLDEFHVPAPEQQELFAIVDSTKNAITATLPKSGTWAIWVSSRMRK